MPLQEAHFVTEIVVGIAIIVSIAFVALELRQNSYLLRKSMADQRAQRTNWMVETICTDDDFRNFERRIHTEYADFDEDEKFRANILGVRILASILNELVSYFDGQITEDEWINLKWNMEHAARRPNVQAAYLWLKDGYSKKVQEYWEVQAALDVSREGRTVSDLLR